jgi:CheY-like chemotaxis protein
LGEGTQFEIYLPALKAPAEKPAITWQLSDVGGMGETVLVVEDDQAARDALASLLESQNYRVLAAQDGNEALQIFDSESAAVALVISDVVMPEMSGLALYHALRERRPLIKVLFITGHPMDLENQVVMHEGHVQWLQKPFTVREFSTTLRAMLGKAA